MAMKELVDRDCGGVNPVMKVASHFTQDRSLTQQGISNNGRISRTAIETRPFGGVGEEELVNEFLSEPLRNMAPQTFQMDGLLREMYEIDGSQMRHAPMRGPTVADLATSDKWAAEFTSEGNHPQQQHQWASEFLDQTPGHHSQGQSVLPYTQQGLSTPWAKEFLEQNEHKILNEDQTDLQRSANELLETANGTALQNTKEGNTMADKWAEEFQNKTENVETADSDFWNNLQKQWEDVAKNDVDNSHAWLSDYTDFQADNYLRDYQFEEDNPLRDHPDPFSEGMAKLKSGDIPNAVLLFEAAVQKDETHAQAWQYLGTTQADNEQERSAIAALNKCLELTPDNLVARMALAVSYTNESLQQQACLTLKQWLYHNPQYSKLFHQQQQAEQQQQGAGGANISSFMSGQIALEVKDMYLRAIQKDQKHIDADLQIGLGVLFNLSAEYDKAVDCFKAALQLRPDDSLLWNKLGATLANSSRSDEAIEAYKRALNLSPGYVRTRYNLGIACINLNAYKQAVEHFLTSLNQQKQSRGPSGQQSVTSNNIWTTMRMAISLMGKPDLYEACDSKDLDALNRHFNIQS